MAEHPYNDHQATPTEGEQYEYRWSYTEQTAFDRMQRKKKQRNGVLIYAITMTAVFLTCIGLLIGVLVWSQSNSTTESGTSDFSSIGAVAKAVKPTTVLINAYTNSAESYGTGFFITETGYIATNYHIIRGASSVKVTTYSGKRLEAEIVGWYEPDDLAVLKVEGNQFSAATMGDSSKVKVGDLAIAIGNPSGAEASWTTTHGIISALNRKVAVSSATFAGEMTMMQTDAPVNPGNSGGPLCNADGEVIGIVTRKLTDYESIGFAIPINAAMVTLSAIIEGKSAQFESQVSHARPLIGISGENITKGEQFRLGSTVYTAKSDGVLIVGVTAGGASENVLQIGDILCVFDGRAVPTVEDLQAVLYNYNIGASVQITVWRQGEMLNLTLTLAP